MLRISKFLAVIGKSPEADKKDSVPAERVIL